jgi:hypothetical protein
VRPSPEASWREAVVDKTAALDGRMKGADDRLATMQKTEKGVKDVVGGIKADMKDALKLEIAATEKVLKAELSAFKDSLKSEVASVKDAFKSVERIFILAVAVFLFGEPVLGGITDVVSAAKAGVSSKE